MSAARGHHRREQRAEEKAAHARHAAEARALQLLAGDGRLDSPGRLAPKIPTVHRYALVAAYAMPADQLRAAQAGAAELDPASRFVLAVACWDCSAPLAAAPIGSSCPAPARR